MHCKKPVHKIHMPVPDIFSVPHIDFVSGFRLDGIFVDKLERTVKQFLPKPRIYVEYQPFKRSSAYIA
jgi:hypothetical protein